MKAPLSQEVLVFVWLAIGVACGSVPLILGIRKQAVGLGVAGAFVCLVFGFYFGFLGAVPMAILFSWLIARAPLPPAAPTRGDDARSREAAAREMLPRARSAPPRDPPSGAPASGAWLPDPHDEAEWRYWDGSRWTEHAAGAAHPAREFPAAGLDPDSPR